MVDIAFDPLTGDATLEQGRLLMIEGAQEKAQRIRHRLLTIKGTWPYDTTFGLDYVGIIWNKQVPMPVKLAHIQDTILLSCDPGDKITNVVYTLDTAQRVFSGSATVISVSGTQLTVGF